MTTTTRPRTRMLRHSIGISLGLALVITLLTAVSPPAANAVEPPRFEFTSENPATLTYGEGLLIDATLTSTTYWVKSPTAVATITDTDVVSPMYRTLGTPTVEQVQTFLSGGESLLDVGAYSVTATATGSHYTEEGSYVIFTVSTAQPLNFSIGPAPLATEVRVIADPNTPTAAVITGRLSGALLDDGYFPAPPGIWQISITDSSGEEVLAISEAVSGGAKAVTSYWPDSTPGEQYSVQASFAPGADVAGNFTVTPSDAFDFTAATEPRPVPTSTATAIATTNVPPAPDFTVPLWALVLVGALAAVLIAAAIILAARARTRRTVGDDGAALEAIGETA